MKKLFLIISLLLIGSTAAGHWEPTAGRYTNEEKQFSAELPGGWMRFDSNDVLLITRDGVLLQAILIERTAPGEKSAVSGVAYREGMKAAEAAEAMISRVKASLKAPFFKVLDRRSVRVANLPAMKVHYEYRDAAGLLYEGIAIGIPKGRVFYGLHYAAPGRHYFHHDLHTFEKVVKSLHLL